MKNNRYVLIVVLILVAIGVVFWLRQSSQDTGNEVAESQLAENVTSTVEVVMPAVIANSESTLPLSPISPVSPIASQPFSSPVKQPTVITDSNIAGTNNNDPDPEAAAEAVVQEASTALTSGNYDKAMELFDFAITINPANSRAFTGRGAVYAARGEYEKALAEYDLALEKDKNNAIALNNKGLAFFALGEYNQAIDSFTAAIEADDQLITTYDRATYYNHRAAVLMELEKHEEALEDLQQAVELNITYSPIHNNLGLVYVNLNDYQKAITHYDDAIRLSPDYGSAYNNRGVAYQKTGQLEKAIADFSKAIELDATDAKLYLNRGLAYWNLEQKGAAALDFEEYLILEPDTPNRTQIESYLAQVD